MANYMILVIDVDSAKTTVLSSDTMPVGDVVPQATGTPHGRTLRLPANGGPLALVHTNNPCTWFYNGQSWYRVCKT